MRLRAPAGRANARRTLLALLGDAGMSAARKQARQRRPRPRVWTPEDLLPMVRDLRAADRDDPSILAAAREHAEQRPPSEGWRGILDAARDGVLRDDDGHALALATTCDRERAAAWHMVLGAAVIRRCKPCPHLTLRSALDTQRSVAHLSFGWLSCGPCAAKFTPSRAKILDPARCDVCDRVSPGGRFHELMVPVALAVVMGNQCRTCHDFLPRKRGWFG